jgi:hypothetical protein
VFVELLIIQMRSAPNAGHQHIRKEPIKKGLMHITALALSLY